MRKWLMASAALVLLGCGSTPLTRQAARDRATAFCKAHSSQTQFFEWNPDSRVAIAACANGQSVRIR